MRPSFKCDVAITPASFTNAATASGNVDTLGFDAMTLDVFMSTSDSTSNNPSVLKLSESDDTVVTNFADITAFVGDTAFTIPNAVTSGDWAYKFNVDLRGRKRYIKTSVSPTTTQVIAAVANLYVGDEAPGDTAAGDMKGVTSG
ncbi:MAG: hypothetical protein OES09_00080 [Gammaproteobacteria bacterium]|nr:hypothetical protein [Gammaproteobacteria bacterium]